MSRRVPLACAWCGGWFIWLVGMLAGPAAGAEPIALSGRAMGTTWTAKFVQPATPLPPSDVSRRIAARLEELEQLFSTYRGDSVVSRFNVMPSTEWVPVARELAGVAAECRRISELTRGAFDVTVAPLVALWGFGADGRRSDLPSEAQIVAARGRVDWHKLEVRAHPPSLRKTQADLAVDFSSLAKGFAADELSALLAALGAADHLVQIGGDMKSSGRSARKTEGWRTGIEQPREGAPEIAVVITLANGSALSTSGDYRNAFVRDGRRYGHIIDPRTGWPVSTSGTSTLAAVSVVHASCATSSALATALFVLGAEDGFRWATEHRIAALFFVRAGESADNAIIQRPTPKWADATDKR